MYNCTVVGNSAIYGGGISSGGYTPYNCIVYYNKALYDDNLTGPVNVPINYCCTTPLPFNGVGNITNEPVFLDLAGLDFRLQSNSPCINAGKNAYASVSDFEGNTRIVGGTVDIGAYEFQFPQSAISYAWLQNFGFPTDGSADSLDPDHDGMSNVQEWIAGTNPTNSLSALLMLSPSNSVSGIAVPWQSVNGITYFLQRGTNLGTQPAFISVQSNLVGQADTTTFIDTNAVGTGPFFYRVGVQQ